MILLFWSINIKFTYHHYIFSISPHRYPSLIRILFHLTQILIRLYASTTHIYLEVSSHHSILYHSLTINRLCKVLLPLLSYLTHHLASTYGIGSLHVDVIWKYSHRECHRSCHLCLSSNNCSPVLWALNMLEFYLGLLRL